MSLPSNGITADVIRDIMPPYRLSFDLLEGPLRALPPPPPGASAAWRQTHLTRLIGEITALKPADAGQARTASDILILRELARTMANRAHAPDVTVPQMCRLSRATAELARTAGGLVRGLERTQQKPVPFYGTVELDEVDVAALDTVWGNGASVLARPDSTRQQDADAPGGFGDLNAGVGPPGVVEADPAMTTREGREGPAVTEANSDDSPATMERKVADSPSVTEGEDGGSHGDGHGNSSDVTSQDGDSIAVVAVGRPEPANSESDTDPTLGVRGDKAEPGARLDARRGASPAA